jgi:hypothetical protein
MENSANNARGELGLGSSKCGATENLTQKPYVAWSSTATDCFRNPQLNLRRGNRSLWRSLGSTVHVPTSLRKRCIVGERSDRRVTRWIDADSAPHSCQAAIDDAPAHPTEGRRHDRDSETRRDEAELESAAGIPPACCCSTASVIAAC